MADISKGAMGWHQEVRESLSDMSAMQSLQRVQLELNLETTPRDSRYSENLVNLMRMEEATVRDGGNSSAGDLTRRVDEALASETRKFFAKNCTNNIKKFKSLALKLEKEREQQRISLIEKIMRLSNSVNENKSIKQSDILSEFMSDGKEIEHVKLPPSGVLTAEDLDDEALRLEGDYNKHFLQYEGFNLIEAFKSQAAKVDKDWGVHEQSLTDDYKARKRAITGVDETYKDAKSGHRVVESDQESRWQHPEKQKTLIHSAPVLVPIQSSTYSSATNGAASSGGGRNARGGKNNKEVKFIYITVVTILYLSS